MTTPDLTARPVRVLLVDDAPEDRVLFRRLLSRADDVTCEIREAGNVAEAEKILAENPPDCLLLDYDLPDGNGLELLRSVVARYGQHAFGIVMLTGSAATVIAVEALQAGAHDFLLKGTINAVLLQQGVRNAVEKAFIHRALEASRLELSRKNEELEEHVIELEREAAERQRAQRELKDNQAFLESVIGATTDCLKVLSLDGGLLWMSDNGRRVMEISDPAWTEGRDWPGFWMLDGKEEQARAVVAAAAAGKVGRLRGRCPTLGGVMKWWDVVVSPINDRDGRPEKILCVSRDVTDIHQSDTALRESEARLRLATAAGKVGVWEWDIVNDKVSWTESLYRVHGLRPGEFGGTRAAFLALIHPEDLTSVQEALHEALGRDEPYEIEFRAVRPTGDVVWLFTNATVIREGDQPVRMVGATLDITICKRAERHTEFLAELTQSLGLLSDPNEMMRVAQEAVGRHLGAKRSFFIEVDLSGQNVTMHEEWRMPGLASAAGSYALTEYGSADYIKKLSEPRLGVSDVTVDPLVREQAHLHLAIQSRAFALGSYHQDGRWVASMGVSTDVVRAWQEDELTLLENTVARIWPHVEKARADRLLIDSAEQLKLAASAAGLGAWTLDTQTDVVNFSERGAEIFGLPPGPYMTWTEMRGLLHEEDRERAKQAVEAALATRGEYGIEYRVIRPNGERVWVSSTGRGQYDSAGALIGMVGVVQDITDRKQAERATRQLAAIVESSDDAIISKNLESRILTWNRGAERLFGYSAQEIVGLPITVLIPPDSHDEEPMILERIRRGEPMEHYETVRRHKSGRLLDVSLTVSPIRDEKGVVVGASKIARDVSRRKATDAMLTRRTQTLEILNRAGEALVAERELEKIAQTVTDAAREICGAQFGAFFYNQVNAQGESYPLCALSGVSRDTFSNYTMLHETALFGPTFQGESTIRIADVWADPVYGKNESHDHRPEGYLPVRSYLAVPVKSGAGTILGGLFFGHPEPDVFTPEAAAEVEALSKQAAIAIENARLCRAMRASEEQLRLVTNNAPVFLLQCDRGYRYTFANQPYAARYGYTPDAIVGRMIAEVVGDAPFEKAKGYIDAALAGEHVEFEMEIPYSHLGSRWVHCIFVPEAAEGGTVPGFVGVLTDITQRKSAELELQRARDEALAGSRAKDDFLAALSHELRTPLNPVLLLASDAAEDKSLSADVRASFETIRRQVNLEARLIDDLLDLTRITRGKLALDLRSVSAHDVLNDALSTVSADLDGKRLTFDVHLDAAVSTVRADAVRLQQVLWNVLKNAVKFTADGGRIIVRTSSQKQPPRFSVSIKDTGIGLTAPELARIFEAFSQGEHASVGGAHRFGGLGLGLAISRSLVEMHGGAIRAESEGRNRGATFIIELPLMTPQTSADHGPNSDINDPAMTTAEMPAAPRRRLLVIEDHAPTRNTLKSLLTRRNFDVQAAGSAVEARELALQQMPDLVVSDIGLPDADGCALMFELRHINPTLPGIALSGYGMEEDLARTRAAGFVEHLTKPVNVGALERAIERIFANTP